MLDLLAGVPEVSSRKMMGEYLLYVSGRLFGGVYDDRFLVKGTGASRAVLSAEEGSRTRARRRCSWWTSEDAEAVSAMVVADAARAARAQEAPSVGLSRSWLRAGPSCP